MKYFRMSYEEIVFKRSYANLMLLNASIPTYMSKGKNKGEKTNKKQHANNYFEGIMGSNKNDKIIDGWHVM
jgi:hypothetical protein